MVYITSDNWDSSFKYSAGNKARDDVFEIAETCELSFFNVPNDDCDRAQLNLIGKIKKHYELYSAWKKSLRSLAANDTLIIQYPLPSQTFLFPNVLAFAKSRGIKTVLFIHDLEMLRWAIRKDLPKIRRMRMNYEQGHSVKKADFLISHNEDMNNFLETNSGCNFCRLITLGIFDYLAEGEAPSDTRLADGPIVIAGSLAPHKAGYIYSLPKDVNFALYGVNLDEERIDSSHVEYCGKFNPDDGPNTIQGSWGLVWDGDSAETCSGVYGEYLRINNPHKTSLYLAAGLPIIIWSQAALAPFVVENKVGITVDSLYDIKSAIDALSDEEYVAMRANALEMSKKLRSGYFTKRVFAEIEHRTSDSKLATSESD